MKIYSIIFGVCCAIVGGILGFGSENLLFLHRMIHQSHFSYPYPYFHTFPVIGIIAGIISGFAAGYFFIRIPVSLLKRKLSRTRFLTYNELYGGVVGILCSSVVFIVLIVSYKVKFSVPIIPGRLFGFCTGFMLSGIISRIIWGRLSACFTTPDEAGSRESACG